MTFLDPVEVLGYRLGGSEKVKVELDNGTDLGSLYGSLEGYHDGIPHGSFLRYSREVQTRSMYSLIMGLSWTGSLEGSHNGIPYGSFLGDSLLNP